MPKELYTAGEAASALGVSLDTLRRWDKAGRIKVQRDASNRRVVPASEIERMRGDGAGSRISARNRFRGSDRGQGRRAHGAGGDRRQRPGPAGRDRHP